MKFEWLSSLPEALARLARQPILWLTLGVTLALAYSWMSPGASAPNERSRLYLALSVLDDGDFAVTEQVEQYGKPFDISERDGKFYSDKAPGSSIVAVPALWVYQALGGAESIEKMVNFARSFVMVPMAVLSFLLLRFLLVGTGVSPPRADVAAVAFALGTTFFHYGAAFFGHAMVTCASLLAAFAIYKSLEAERGPGRMAWQVLVGFAGGLAFAIEYQAAVICVGIALGYLSVRDNWRPAAILLPLVGAALPIGLTLFYNDVAFGSPFSTSYAHLHHAQFQEAHQKGLFGVTFPTMDALYGLLFSPSRGLLLCAPIVFLGWFGLPALWKRCRWLAIYAGITMVGYMYIVAGTDVWYGGWSFGPRLLVPMFGLAAVAGAFALERAASSTRLSAGLAGLLVFAIGYNIFVTAMFPELPHDIQVPLETIALPLAELGKPSPNLGMILLGLEGLTSLVPLFLVVIALCAYILARQAGSALRRPAPVAALATTLFLALVVVMGYPETFPQKKADGLVKHLAGKRIEAK